MSYRVLSPTADRDLALVGLLVAALASLMALAAAVVLGAVITTTLLGGDWQIPGIDAWIAALFRVLGNPTHPGAALGDPWAGTLAGHTGLYWLVTVLVTVLGGAAVAVVGVPAWRRFGPTPAGHATRADIRRELSLTAARASAEWTRPSLPPAQRRRAVLEDVAAPCTAARATPSSRNFSGGVPASNLRAAYAETGSWTSTISMALVVKNADRSSGAAVMALMCSVNAEKSWP